jgi:Peptidase M50B-like
MVVGLSLFFSAILLGAIFIEWFAFQPFLEFVTLYFGVFIGFYAVKDIYDDLITRTAEGSDAVACNQLIPCCLPRCVGVQFWCCAFCFQVLGIYLALVRMVSSSTEE